MQMYDIIIKNYHCLKEAHWFMENKQSAAKSGNLKISEDVIVSITKIAVSNIKEVKEITPFNKSCPNGMAMFKNTVHKIKEKKNKSEQSENISKKSGMIKVNFLGDVLEITISVIVKGGSKIIEVAERIQEAVKSSVQSMTGIPVSRVNVNINGISF